MPSSVHAEGRAARAARSRRRGSGSRRWSGARAKNVIFTSGGTEANNAVLSPGLRRAARGGGRVAASCQRDRARFACWTDIGFAPEAARRLPVDGDGVADLAGSRLTGAPCGTSASSSRVQVANNETGVLQPVAEAARIVHAHGGLLHADAVQAAGKLPLDGARSARTLLTLSAHKLGGPKGVGAIVLASDQIEIADRLIRGGGQESGFRAGTENVAGDRRVRGRGRSALCGTCEPNWPRCRRLRDALRGRASRRLRRKPSFRRRAPSGCRTPWRSRYPASGPRPR